MSPLHYTAMTNLRALSSSGASRAFDAAADGFIPGEGVVTIVIKPLTTAQQDGDRIRAIIKGTAINHGGRTSGLTVPNSTAQYEVITAALQDAQTDPQTIQLVEAHGTGTSLGDPIEIEGLTKAWRQSTNRRQYAAIGSLKTNLGHLEPAAGLAGLIKALLAIEHEQIPPTLHVTRPNDHIRFEDTPFYIADRPTPWPRTTTPRRAAISAFGMGGVNAHVIIEEPPTPPTRPPHTQDNFLLKVTGATPEAVRHLATAYANRFAESRDAWETADLCHTANIGRSELEFQTAVAGRDAAELAEALRAVAAGAIPVTRADAAASPPASARVEDVAEAVRRGYGQVDWASFSPPSARVADLPTYPFAQERYWHLRPGAAGENGAGPALARSVEDAVASGLPAAARIRWRRHALDLPAGPQPHRVRIVAPRPVIPAVAGALHEAGLSVAANAEPADAVVVVYEPDAGATSDLSGFWDDLQTLLASLPAHARVVWASHHWAAVGEDERARLLPQVAAGAAAVRAACAENRLACAVVDLDPADPIETRARHLASEVAALRPGTDTAAAYRAQSRFVPEPVPAIADEPVELSSDGYYLVTGGLGGVGRRLVEQLAACGARHIGILGRSRPHTAASLRELSRQAQIEYLSCDVTDDDALRAAAAAFAKRWGRLLGVVHCSGSANPFGSVRRREWTDAANVTAPKVAGSLNVVRLAKAEGAHFVVLVSSIAGAMPEAGRGLVDYALANAYQLALAERESDGPTVVTAHAWPAWAGVGMRADASFAATHAISAEQALRAFTSYLRAGGSVIFPGGALPAPPDPITTPVAASGEAPSTLVTLVRDAFVDVLGQDPGDRPVAELGLDSLTIADLAAALQRRYGRPVLPSIIMRANTIDDIAAALAPNSPTAAASAAVIPTPRPPTDANLGDLLRPFAGPGRAGLTGAAGRRSCERDR